MVGIERDNQRILNPESDTVLQPGDNLFIVANRKKVREFLSGMGDKRREGPHHANSRPDSAW